MDYQLISLEYTQTQVAVLTLNRPDAANALNTLLALEMGDALKKIADNHTLRALVLTGAGSRAFCAGADLKERKAMDESAWNAQHHAFEAAIATLDALEIPTIAAINGAAIAGGLELALACDFRLSAPHARFGFTEARLGIMPGLGGTQRLPRLIGMQAALDMLLTADIISAEKACALGIISRISDGDVLTDALAFAARIVASAPLSVRAIKQSVKHGMEQPLADALHYELGLYATLINTADRVEGITAFNEKRAPHFRGD